MKAKQQSETSGFENMGDDNSFMNYGDSNEQFTDVVENFDDAVEPEPEPKNNIMSIHIF